MAEPKTEGVVLSPEAKKRQRARNIAIAGGLVFLCALFYLITIFKMGPNILVRAL